jgi:hypothetical protein
VPSNGSAACEQGSRVALRPDRSSVFGKDVASTDSLKGASSAGQLVGGKQVDIRPNRSATVPMTFVEARNTLQS